MDTRFIRLQTLTTYRICLRTRCWSIHAAPYGPGKLKSLHAMENHDLIRSSIIPCLAIRGVASAIARSRSLRAKVLLRELFANQCREPYLILPSECTER